MRKYYLDNLRWLIILILFPYHVLLVYTPISSYYINAASNVIASVFILSFAPWFMQLLFVIAGIATYYSLKRRDATEYLKERVSKLFIPMVAGMILVIPFSTYYAFLLNDYTGIYLNLNGYTGSFLNLWVELFTNPLHYFQQGILIGPLWFLLYLFIVSLVALPIIMKYKKADWKIPTEKITIPKLISLIIPLTIASFFLNIFPEKSIAQIFLLFIFGYFLLSSESVQEKLEKRRWPLFISFLLINMLYVAMALSFLNTAADGSVTIPSTLDIIVSLLITKLMINSIIWLGVLGVIGMGKHYLEFNNSKTLYLSTVSFPIYIFHIVWVNFFIYYTIKLIPDLMLVQIILSLILSFILTIVTIEVVKRIPIIRSLFGIKA